MSVASIYSLQWHNLQAFSGWQSSNSSPCHSGAYLQSLLTGVLGLWKVYRSAGFSFQTVAPLIALCRPTDLVNPVLQTGLPIFLQNKATWESVKHLGVVLALLDLKGHPWCWIYIWLRVVLATVQVSEVSGFVLVLPSLTQQTSRQ